MLDPACGSGTFLYQTILFKRQRLGQSAKTLKHIEENVVAIDIHPLAVIVAKTTYLLGLGDLLEKQARQSEFPFISRTLSSRPRSGCGGKRRTFKKRSPFAFRPIWFR